MVVLVIIIVMAVIVIVAATLPESHVMVRVVQRRTPRAIQVYSFCDADLQGAGRAPCDCFTRPDSQLRVLPQPEVGPLHQVSGKTDRWEMPKARYVYLKVNEDATCIHHPPLILTDVQHLSCDLKATATYRIMRRNMRKGPWGSFFFQLNMRFFRI